MPDLYMGKIPIVRRSLNEGWIRGVPLQLPETGAVERDFSEDPVEMRDDPTGMRTYAESEWDAIYDERQATQSGLLHMFLRGDKPAFQFLDQNGFPDCWCYSTAHAYMLDCMKQNIPIPRINATAMATMLGRTNGGWSGLSMKFARENGVPLMGTGQAEWPEHTRNRKYDTPELRAKMKARMPLEDWYDLGKKEYDQELSKRQLATCGFDNVPAQSDFNRASHAMCQIDWVRLERGSWGPAVLNSWKGFGYFGVAILQEWWADGAVALRSTVPIS